MTSEAEEIEAEETEDKGTLTPEGGPTVFGFETCSGDM